MRAIVNSDLCEANAVCVRSCPEVFRLEEDDTLTILLDEIPEALRSGVEIRPKSRYFAGLVWNPPWLRYTRPGTSS